MVVECLEVEGMVRSKARGERYLSLSACVDILVGKFDTRQALPVKLSFTLELASVNHLAWKVIWSHF